MLKSPSEAGDEHNRKVCAALLSLWHSDFKTFTCFWFACHPAVAFWEPAGHQQARQLYCGTVGAWHMAFGWFNRKFDMLRWLNSNSCLLCDDWWTSNQIESDHKFRPPRHACLYPIKKCSKKQSSQTCTERMKAPKGECYKRTKKAKNLSLSHFSIKLNIENKSNSSAHSSLFSIPIISVEARLMYLIFILYIAHPHESVSSFVLHLPVKVNNECTKKNPQVFIFAIIAIHLAEIYNAKNPRS